MDSVLLHKPLMESDNEMLLQKTVCVQHTQTYKLTRTYTRSLKRNEDKGLWRPWLAVLFVKVELTYLHMHTHKCLGPWIQLQRRTESRKQREKVK